jgi:hypothetical protein
MSENQLRETIARFGKSFFDRGLTFGSTGNISLRVDDGRLITQLSRKYLHVFVGARRRYFYESKASARAEPARI